ncbi:MAG: hypothetical protein CL844_05590 [Crocinitomicaceae bacterium]|nr:hypothetical protein [Crocinitomicaceae bacterium]
MVIVEPRLPQRLHQRLHRVVVETAVVEVEVHDPKAAAPHGRDELLDAASADPRLLQLQAVHGDGVAAPAAAQRVHEGLDARRPDRVVGEADLQVRPRGRVEGLVQGVGQEAHSRAREVQRVEVEGLAVKLLDARLRVGQQRAAHEQAVDRVRLLVVIEPDAFALAQRLERLAPAYREPHEAVGVRERVPQEVGGRRAHHARVRHHAHVGELGERGEVHLGCEGLAARAHEQPRHARDEHVEDEARIVDGAVDPVHVQLALAQVRLGRVAEQAADAEHRALRREREVRRAEQVVEDANVGEKVGHGWAKKTRGTNCSPSTQQLQTRSALRDLRAHNLCAYSMILVS